MPLECHGAITRWKTGVGLTIVLAGNPNVGKSSVFNRLTGLGVETARTKRGVTFTVTDAGEPVKGAKVTFKKKTLTTSAKGVAQAPSGTSAATVSATGYGTVEVTVE